MLPVVWDPSPSLLSRSHPLQGRTRCLSSSLQKHPNSSSPPPYLSCSIKPTELVNALPEEHVGAVCNPQCTLGILTAVYGAVSETLKPCRTCDKETWWSCTLNTLRYGRRVKFSCLVMCEQSNCSVLALPGHVWPRQHELTLNQTDARVLEHSN